MKVKFITGNANKLEEVKKMLSPVEVEQLDVDLAEIQSLDAHKIIRHKLQEALTNSETNIIVEDTSLYLECLKDKLPGPYIKWFLESLKPEGIANLAKKMGNTKAFCLTIFGYAKSKDEIEFFEGRNDGEIVEPRGGKDFGWGPIFQPRGSDKTYGEMERDEKYATSMRAAAAKKLKEYLLR
ncbi:MAG: non-canonical purine NTP pyrophosphatase [Candidatus Doudnabacteria bacterium]